MTWLSGDLQKTTIILLSQRIMSLLEGCPPKVIHLLCGNRTTAFIEQLILSKVDKLLHFSSA